MKVVATAILGSFLLGSACGADQASFRPTTHVSASGYGGQPAASYDVRVASGTIAHVNVWSRGAYEARDGGTIIHLVADVQNTGDQPVTFRRGRLRLEAFTRSGVPLQQPRLIAASGLDDLIPPDEPRLVDLQFAMPTPIDPDRIGALRLRWALGYDDGRRYVQFTEFQRVPEPVYATGVVIYDPVFGFYDPFIYGPPYLYHYRYRVPIRRVIVPDVPDHDRGRRRAESAPERPQARRD